MSVEAVAKDEIALVKRKLHMNKWSATADFWQAGVNQTLRISDLLKLRYDQLTGDVLEIIEGNPQKNRRIIINKTAREVIDRRRREYSEHIYLFQSVGNRIKSPPETTAPSVHNKPVSAGWVSQAQDQKQLPKQ